LSPQQPPQNGTHALQGTGTGFLFLCVVRPCGLIHTEGRRRFLF
jgi:hypothetical protein